MADVAPALKSASRARWLPTFLAAALVGAAFPASAQLPDHVREQRAATPAEVFGVNILIGGLTASTRALLTGKDPFRAFGMGALGGAVHFGGKYVAGQNGAANGWLGIVVAATGTSIVSNAGRGVSPVEELSIPIGPVRVRVSGAPGAARTSRVVVNGFELAMILGAFATDELQMDWNRTVSSGAFVFVTRNAHIIGRDGSEVGGFAAPPVIVIGSFAEDAQRTMRHEAVHVQQQWFMHDAWGRPIEDFLRSRLAWARYVPSWLELGLIAPGLLIAEDRLTGSSGVRRLMQAEAVRLQRR